MRKTYSFGPQVIYSVVVDSGLEIQQSKDSAGARAWEGAHIQPWTLSCPSGKAME